VPPLTRFVTEVTVASVAPPSAILCKPFLWKNQAADNNGYLVATKYPLLSAAWFFHKNGLHKIADGGATDAVVTSVTKRVNGGTIGLPDRIKHFKEYYSLLA